ncbi:hypothetical protein EI555_018997, partial [Monodon monoceros]
TRRAGSPAAAAAKCGKDLWEGPVGPDLAVQGITIIFTSLNTNLTRGTKEKHLKVKGPVQMFQDLGWFSEEAPQRLTDLHSPEMVKQITSINTEPGVRAEVTTANAEINF